MFFNVEVRRPPAVFLKICWHGLAASGNFGSIKMVSSGAVWRPQVFFVSSRWTFLVGSGAPRCPRSRAPKTQQTWVPSTSACRISTSVSISSTAMLREVGPRRCLALPSNRTIRLHTNTADYAVTAA